MLEKVEKDSKRFFAILIFIFILVFIFIKFNVIGLGKGLLLLIIVYALSLFEVQDLFFSSKRVKFLFYLFTISDIIMFMISDFSMTKIILFIFTILFISYISIKIEGKNKIVNIRNNALVYIFLKVIFLLTVCLI